MHAPLRTRGNLRGAAAAAFGVALALAAGGQPAAAQAATTRCFTFWETLGAAHLDLDRLHALAGTREPTTEALYRAGLAQARLCGAGEPGAAPGWSVRDLGLPSITILPAASILQHNGAYPRTQRDGARWAGRGRSGAVTAGAHARWGPISAAFAPVLGFHQNEQFPVLHPATEGLSEWGSYFHAGVIDLPQRFGDESDRWAHPGQSYIRADAYGAALGVSTETLRWGPARRNPILMSGTAPGFFHAFVGTSGPADVGIGRLEVEAVWGRLEESSYFDTDPDNDTRLLAGLVIAFSPGASSGLTLGAARVYSRTIPPGGLPLGELILGPYRDVRENPGADAPDPDNQLLSLFLRWGLPAAGFEAYGEYAREDHWDHFEDLVMEPDHSRGYTVGFQKAFTRASGDPRLRVAAEATNLNASSAWRSGRFLTTFYVHSQVRQGHTHRGQLLGAPIGPGSDAQYVAADYLWPGGLVGASFERIRYDNDTYYNTFAHRFTYAGHDTELTPALRGVYLLRGFQLVGEVALSVRYNRGFLELHRATSVPTTEENLSVSVGAAWVPGLRFDF
ncbi:MAG TPA: capsule assembly Wzi family protein [Longimicrobiales bacterium]|nr:capsule assembly Wzi family protein [Longimicrobiales bacterium]